MRPRAPKLNGCHDKMRGSSPRILHSVRHTPVGQQRQALEREGRTRAVPHEPLACLVVVRRHAHCRMDVEPLHRGCEPLFSPRTQRL